MKTGFIGLGKMGFNMVEHLLELGHEVVAFDLSAEAVAAIAEKGATAASSLQHVVGDLPKPRVVWMMVPAGRAVDAVLDGLLPFLDRGDIVIDGGNSRYTDSVARAERLRQAGVRLLDVGTSGGLDGARHGACMMAGGEREAYEYVEPLLRGLCVPDGCGYMGVSGAGHFVKMVHNGIEYGMMQAIGEGFDLLRASGFDLDNETVARVWSNGSVIRGWLMELAGKAFAQDNDLGWLGGKVADSGEGRWTVEAAIDLGVAVPIISGALFRRFRSQSEENFSDKVVAALRHGFGGHAYQAPGAGEEKA
ncbi:decarboxylating 6-phosphogluconate dehydrogenase [Chlorobaculum sp. 24CR]|uniref:phosphogluconate dehydrogenase (NAD(+)-dependent, decarboxylating) n=1 Tax=Chlorobaculum sp. 24CR TaxID=2508878 RepID=UPI00100B30DF|nr:decarboxylating 6-phosphogluconate dehydrogenase [Chlorobaculum sp. 24CR]RXK85057.1 decarboxylating 6-phosphogluconate dehydrogenase [Chlorobaculum sp. 24CR]